MSTPEMPLALKLRCVRHGVSFYECLMTNAATTGLVAEFDRLHRTNLLQRGTPIERMIDKATGRMNQDVEKFIDFVWEFVFLRFSGEEKVA